MKILFKNLVGPLVSGVCLIALAINVIQGFERQRQDLDSIQQANVQLSKLSLVPTLASEAQTYGYKVMTWTGVKNEKQIAEFTKKGIEKSAEAKKILKESKIFLEQSKIRNKVAVEGIKAIEKSISDSVLSLEKLAKTISTAQEMAEVDPEMGLSALQSVDEYYEQLNKNIGVLEQNKEHMWKEIQDQSIKLGNELERTLFILVLIALFVPLCLSVWIAQRISNRVGGAQRIAQDLKNGIFNKPIKKQVKVGGDEVDQLLEALDKMRLQLEHNTLLRSQTVQTLKQSSEKSVEALKKMEEGTLRQQEQLDEVDILIKNIHQGSVQTQQEVQEVSVAVNSATELAKKRGYNY